MCSQNPETYAESDVGPGVEGMCRTLVLTFEGTASNDMAPAVQQLFDELKVVVSDYCVVILDWRRVDFCYSAVVRALIDFAMSEPFDCKKVIRAHPTKTWQQTSLRALAKLTRAVFLSSFPPEDPRNPD
jgi:hypothetical protein